MPSAPLCSDLKVHKIRNSGRTFTANGLFEHNSTMFHVHILYNDLQKISNALCYISIHHNNFSVYILHSCMVLNTCIIIDLFVVHDISITGIYIFLCLYILNEILILIIKLLVNLKIVFCLHYNSGA